jgi:SSS family solute:Na+ symporter
MADQIDWVALSVFIFFFALVTVMGFFAARWKSGPVSEHLDEWGLGGRQFGTWITWFLVGGDFYTAYTVIAVPALVYAVGAYGFFALPYTIIVYPFVFAVMPILWKQAHANGPHRHGRHHALHRATIDRHGRGDQGHGAGRRIAHCCCLHHSRALHL